MHCSGSSVEERAWRDAHRQHPGMMQVCSIMLPADDAAVCLLSWEREMI